MSIQKDDIVENVSMVIVNLLVKKYQLGFQFKNCCYQLKFDFLSQRLKRTIITFIHFVIITIVG